MSKPGPTVKFLNPFVTAQRMVRRLRARGATVIIALTHLSIADDQKLSRIPGIDLVIGGHEHRVIQSLVGRTLILKMGADARNLGRIDLTLSSTGKLQDITWDIIPVTPAVGEDEATKQVVAEYETKLDQSLAQKIGQTEVVLNATEENRRRETNLGNFITDVYREALEADVALAIGGGIRSDATYGPGELTKKTVVTILPFDNTLVKAKVTGQMLREALEHGLSKYPATGGLFPQVSGLQFEFDPARSVGQRITKILVKGQPLDVSREYTMATNSYILSGGDGYSMFERAQVLLPPEGGPIESEVVMQAIEKAGTIAPQVEGRIRAVPAK